MTPSLVFESHNDLHLYEGGNDTLDFVDKELSTNLDSTDAFEGPEKLLELWFALTPEKLPASWNGKSLFDIPLLEIENLLNVVHCQILSKIHNEHFHAYLLSESSLFVYPHKMVLKTCGTTTTLLCLDKLTQLIQSFIDPTLENLKSIYRVFYSHRSFMFPEKQIDIHQNWDSELSHLNNYFNSSTAKQYILGDQSDKCNQWHFYVNGDVNLVTVPSDDITVEILMTNLDPAIASKFYVGEGVKKVATQSGEADCGHILGKQMMEKCGLHALLPCSEIRHDAFAFTPCGYSSNSLCNDAYATVHITPEHGWSYASFETNFRIANDAELEELVGNVVSKLRPAQYTVLVCYEGERREWAVDRRENYVHGADIAVGLGYRVLCAQYRV